MTIPILSWKIMQTRKRESLGVVIDQGKVPIHALPPKSDRKSSHIFCCDSTWMTSSGFSDWCSIFIFAIFLNFACTEKYGWLLSYNIYIDLVIIIFIFMGTLWLMLVTLAYFFLICDDVSLIRQNQRILAIYVRHVKRSLNQGNLSLFVSML